MELPEILSRLGFTPIEAKAYLCLVKEEQMKISEIAKKTKITRTQLYPLVKRMMQKGYLEEINTTPANYKTVPPTQLVGLLEKEQKNQFSLLLKLKPELEQLAPIQTVAAAQYDINVINGEKNILAKLSRLINASEKEIVNTCVFERLLADRSKDISQSLKKKAREGVKLIVHSSVKPENLGKISRLRSLFNGISFSGLAKEEPYVTYIFDRQKLLLVFFDPRREIYDTALYIENEALANSFALKNIAPIESCPLTGELFLSAVSRDRCFLLPSNSLNSLSKRQLFDVGYSIGYSFGEKNIKEKGNRNIGANYVLSTLATQLSISGWAKVGFERVKPDRLALVIHNSAVKCRLIKGVLSGFLSVVGRYKVLEEKCADKGKDYCEFLVEPKTDSRKIGGRR